MRTHSLTINVLGTTSLERTWSRDHGTTVEVGTIPPKITTVTMVTRVIRVTWVVTVSLLRLDKVRFTYFCKADNKFKTHFVCWNVASQESFLIFPLESMNLTSHISENYNNNNNNNFNQQQRGGPRRSFSNEGHDGTRGRGDGSRGRRGFRGGDRGSFRGRVVLKLQLLCAGCCCVAFLKMC